MHLKTRSELHEGPDLSGHRQLLAMSSAYWQSQALFAAVSTGLVDALGERPKTSDALAADVACDSGAVSRLLRYLTAVGVVDRADGEDGWTYRSTELTNQLQAGSAFREFVLLFGGEFYRASTKFSDTVRTGEPSYNLEYGRGIFDDMAGKPQEASRFDVAMEATTQHIARRLARMVDFTECRLVVDVGGGNGTLLEEVLACAPHSKGLVLDLPHVAAACRKRVAQTAVASRLDATACDVFTGLPEGGDAYVLSRVMHDWHDAACLQILGNIRAVVNDRAPLLVLERLLPDEPSPTLAAAFDIMMMALTGGRERTLHDFERLLGEAGFRIDSVHSLPFEMGLMIAYPVTPESYPRLDVRQDHHDKYTARRAAPLGRHNRALQQSPAAPQSTSLRHPRSMRPRSLVAPQSCRSAKRCDDPVRSEEA